MSQLLRIDSSPSPASVSRHLTDTFVERWRAGHPGGTVVVRDTTVSGLAPIDAAWIGANFTPPEARTPEQHAALALSEQLIDELTAADEYVIGVAMHNFGIAGNLKLWIDQVMRVGRTFRYTETGPVGLLTGKKATLIVASGGHYQPDTAMAGMNFADPYLSQILRFMGVNDIRVIHAGGVALLGNDTAARETFLRERAAHVASHVEAAA